MASAAAGVGSWGLLPAVEGEAGTAAGGGGTGGLLPTWAIIVGMGKGAALGDPVSGKGLSSWAARDASCCMAAAVDACAAVGPGAGADVGAAIGPKRRPEVANLPYNPYDPYPYGPYDPYDPYPPP